MSETIPTPNPRHAASTRSALRRALAVAGVMLLGVAAVSGLEAAMHATFNKPPAPLRRRLTTISSMLGSPIRYRSNGPDQVLRTDYEETLGTNEYVMREYLDKTLPADAPGSLISLNVNYYDTGSSTPHVPEICWAATGREEADTTRNIFEIKDVVRKDGTTTDLRVRMISFKPVRGQPETNENGEPIYTNVAYLFHVNGAYVASPQEVTSQFWKASYKYAYHAKIEITPVDPRAQDPKNPYVHGPLNCTQKEAQEIVSNFLRAALPEIEDCLPDPSILTDKPATASQGAQ
jgi:hypothetical protein